jgi:hypothetical protein
VNAVQPRVIVGFDSEWTFAKEGENQILSWQFVVLNADTGATSETFLEPKGPTRRHRIALSHGLSEALHKARCEGVIPFIPNKLTVACHFARADITTVRDFATIKRHLTAVRKTYATTRRPLTLRIATPERKLKCKVRLVDTMLLTAANTKLERLGADLGVPKVSLPEGYAKDRMDLFLVERREDFINYAMTDARIAALWVARIDEILNSLGVARGIATLGAASVDLARHQLASLNVDFDWFFGLEKPKRGKAHPRPELVGLWPYAAQCYHGGMNVAFALGLSPERRDLVDVDLKSAYTTALALIRIPDWNTVRQTRDLAELAEVESAMTFAHVKFEFPSSTRFPNLPVRTSNNRGLVYPLKGKSWCTGPEIVVARSQGARIKPLSGWRIDWLPWAVRPFEGFTRRINEVRAKAQATNDTVLNKTVKEIGNSLYGKIAQAVASLRIIQDDVVLRRTFNTKWGRSDTLGPSPISQPMFASYCTGLVRAALCEALSRLPLDEWLATATTDGFLFAGDISHIDTSGPAARAFAAGRKRIKSTDSDIWEVKHVIPRALVIKTRGTFTVAPPEWSGDAICAQAGYRLPDADAPWLSDLERSNRWVEHYRTRNYETRFENPSLTSLRDQHNKDLDLQKTDRMVRWNADFDLKRRPVNVRDEDGLIAADTVPWRTVEEFEEARDALDEWRGSQRRVLKTATDYRDMITWAAASNSRRAVGARTHNRLPPVARAAMLADIHGALGMEKMSYCRIAQKWAALCCVPISVFNVKDAKRRGAAPGALAGSIDYFTVQDETLATAMLRSQIKAMDLLKQLCKSGSQAQNRLRDAIDCVMVERLMEGEPEFPAVDEFPPEDEPDFGPDFKPEDEPGVSLGDEPDLEPEEGPDFEIEGDFRFEDEPDLEPGDGPVDLFGPEFDA